MHPKDHCLALRVMPDCDREGLIFLSTPIIDSFSCTPFISEHRFCNNAVTSFADFRHIVMVLRWRLMMSLHSVV